jgi:hypothetical protein
MEDNIIMDLREIGWEVVDTSESGWGPVAGWRAVVKTGMKPLRSI